MCIPKPNPQVAQPTDIASVQSASGLEIGGSAAPRGAAQLGRLALRMGNTAQATSPSISASSQAQAQAASTVAPPPAPNASTNTPAAEAQIPGVGTSPGSLAGLRFGNFNTAFA